MTMSCIWAGMLAVAVLAGLLKGNAEEVAAAAMSGAGEAVKLCLSIGGAVCLWSGIMEIMKRAGLSAKLAALLKAPLRFLFKGAKHSEVLEPLAENVSANLLGLGNAATPAGILAAQRLKNGETATDDLCMLVVMNTASIQLIPATVAAVRAAAGAGSAFDILPAVWITSAVSVIVGVLCAKLLAAASRKKR